MLLCEAPSHLQWGDENPGYNWAILWMQAGVLFARIKLCVTKRASKGDEREEGRGTTRRRSDLRLEALRDQRADLWELQDRSLSYTGALMGAAR